MTHDQAAEYVRQQAPELIIDNINPAFPRMLTVRKEEGGGPFCITLPAVEDTNILDFGIKSAREVLG